MLTSIETAQCLTFTNVVITKVKEDTLSLKTTQAANSPVRERMSDYVAELQLHMTLQARNLVPNLTYKLDSRSSLLQDSQAKFEKLVSRQVF